jgi:UV radiation resistance-associated gene protein
MRTVFLNVTKTQSAMIENIFVLYPIEQDCICSFSLPNSVFNKLDKEEIAIALGYTSHTVLLLANYLFIPLKYPIYFKSSRSSILDIISNAVVGSRQFVMLTRFPLYSKGAETLRFEYAVFLLNKDIEQLMNAVGLPVRNLRNTLSNVQAIAQRLEQYKMLFRVNLESTTQSLSAR